MASTKDRVSLSHPTVPKEVDRYLVPTEQVVFILHRHWMSKIREISIVAGGVVLLLVVQIFSGWALPFWFSLVILVGLATFGVFIYVEWEHEVFMSTDRRLMLVHGIVTRKVDIMPLGKLTDMRYDRSPISKIFGYGTFVVESAGQDQALSTINFVPTPDTIYRKINGLLFAPSSRRIGDRPPPMGSALPLQEPNDMWWKKR